MLIRTRNSVCFLSGWFVGMGPVLFKYIPDQETTDVEDRATQRYVFYLTSHVNSKPLSRILPQSNKHSGLILLTENVQ